MHTPHHFTVPVFTLAVALGFFSMPFAGAQVFYSESYNLSTEAQFTDNFTLSTSGATNVAWNSGNGVGGVSGYLAVTSDGGTRHIGHNPSLGAFSTGDSATISMMFAGGNFVGSTSAFAHSLAGVGLRSNSPVGGENPSDLLGVDLLSPATANAPFQLRINATTSGENLSLPTGVWYEIEGVFTLADDSQSLWNVTANIYSRGADGAAVRTELDTFTLNNITNAGLVGSTNVFANMRVSRNSTDGASINSLDNINITAVPEPGSGALLLGLGAALYAIRRRRRAIK